MYPYFKRQNNITKLGILVSDLRPSTKNYALIDLGNKIARENSDIDFYVFNSDWHVPPHTISFPLLQQRNAWGFDGILISTDIPTTRKLIALPNTCKAKMFYVWNMSEWETLSSASEVESIYCNKELTLIARSNIYANILSQNFTIPLIMKDFDYDSCTKLCKLYR